MKETIAQFLKVKEFPFTIENKNGKIIYHESSLGTWIKREYDSNNREIYYESSYGYWVKYEYGSNNNEIYYEDSKGNVRDNRPKPVELTLDEIANKLGINVSQLKIKK